MIKYSKKRSINTVFSNQKFIMVIILATFLVTLRLKDTIMSGNNRKFRGGGKIISLS